MLSFYKLQGFKRIQGQGDVARVRLNISDGAHSTTFAMLGTQLNHIIAHGRLDNNCVIRADKVVFNYTVVWQGVARWVASSFSSDMIMIGLLLSFVIYCRRVLIILELTVLATG